MIGFRRFIRSQVIKIDVHNDADYEYFPVRNETRFDELMLMWLETDEGKEALYSHQLGLQNRKIRFSRIRIQIDLDKRIAAT